MTKDISTLVEDIEAVLSGAGGWEAWTSEWLAQDIQSVATARFMGEPRARNTLTLSGIGQACKRKLWLRVNSTVEGEPLPPSAHLKFFYGDLVESMILALAQAAGHKVEGMQDVLHCEGIKGHRDAVIDGVTIDVKSASTYAFGKFRDGNLRADDPFGYISQLSSYVAAAADDPLVTDKTKGGFLVMDKVHGHLCLDMYDFTHEVRAKPQEIQDVRDMVADPIAPDVMDDKPYGKSGNRELGMQCHYCELKHHCWPNLRTFKAYKGPVHLTQVDREPRMEEITDG